MQRKRRRGIAIFADAKCNILVADVGTACRGGEGGIPAQPGLAVALARVILRNSAMPKPAYTASPAHKISCLLPFFAVRWDNESVVEGDA